MVVLIHIIASSDINNVWMKLQHVQSYNIVPLYNLSLSLPHALWRIPNYSRNLPVMPWWADGRTESVKAGHTLADLTKHHRKEHKTRRHNLEENDYGHVPSLSSFCFLIPSFLLTSRQLFTTTKLMGKGTRKKFSRPINLRYYFSWTRRRELPVLGEHTLVPTLHCHDYMQG